jgi:hypothetical protein
MFKKLQLSLKRENCGTKFFRLLLRLHLTSFLCSSLLSIINFLLVSLTVPSPSTLVSQDRKNRSSRQKLFISRTRRNVRNKIYGIRKNRHIPTGRTFAPFSFYSSSEMNKELIEFSIFRRPSSCENKCLNF